MRVLTDGIMLGFAVYTSTCDWKSQRIPVAHLWNYTVAAILCTLLHIEGRLLLTAVGLLIGATFFVISKVTKESIGYGDSWVITLFGIYVGGKDLVRLLFTASFFAGLVSLIWMAAHQWKREKELPFVPFLTLGLMEVIFL